MSTSLQISMRNFKGIMYNWTAIEQVKPCALLCQAMENPDIVVKLADKVVDGTRCHDDESLDICVEGECRVTKQPTMPYRQALLAKFKFRGKKVVTLIFKVSY